MAKLKSLTRLSLFNAEFLSHPLGDIDEFDQLDSVTHLVVGLVYGFKNDQFVSFCEDSFTQQVRRIFPALISLYHKTGNIDLMGRFQGTIVDPPIVGLPGERAAYQEYNVTSELKQLAASVAAYQRECKRKEE